MAKSPVRQGLHKLRAIRPARIRQLAHRPFQLRLAGASEADFDALSRVFIPDTLSSAERAQALPYLVNGGSPSSFSEVRVCTPACIGQGSVVDPADPEPGLLAVLGNHPDLSLALGRVFPPLRPLLARELIRAVAARNAAIAAISALPEVIPTPLSLLLALGEMGSDTILLTANQMSLAFELAALRGEEVSWRAQAGPAFGILAAAFGWRSLARELVGLIPAGFGLAAKTGIAYSATLATGAALWKYPQRQARIRPNVESTPALRPLASGRQSA